jgi:predicted CXXCH cytochrome family protein
VWSNSCVSAWLHVAFLCVAALGLAFLSSQRRMLAWPLWLFGGVAVVTVLAAFVGIEDPTDYAAQHLIPEPVEQDGYLSSDACRSCHPDEYDSWKRTYHRTMTQVVGPQTVVAPFAGESALVGGLKHEFTREGDQFFVTASQAGPDGTQQVSKQRVVMSTGSHHYQVYWVQTEVHTEPKEVTLYWNIQDKRWVPKSDTLITPPGVHGDSGSWNTHCIRCHSVNGKPNFRPGGSYDSTVAEFGIACESCHGPGEAHVRSHQNPLSRYRAAQDGKARDATIANPAKLDARASSQVCGRCHAGYSQDMEQYVLHGFRYRPGDDIEKEVTFYDMARPKPGLEEYIATQSWRDGTSRTGGDEYNAHMKSPCFEAGELSCVSCHSLHDSDPNDQLAKDMSGNGACLQCHEEIGTELVEHTHHAQGSEGSLCYNCHMPHTTWALSTAMRSHRIDSPNAGLSARTTRPNACNLCHLDKTLGWTAERLSEWYGQPAVTLDEDQRQLASSAIWLLRGDAVQRAVWAWHYGWEPAMRVSGEGFRAPLLAQLLDDPYSQVRYVAGKSLAKQPGFEQFDFDFIAAAETRGRRKAEAMARWQARRPNVARPQLLIDGELGLSLTQVRALQAVRDDTPIDLPE